METEFDEWWGGNEKQFMADACHMSEYHMAHVVWKAATEAARESCKTLALNYAAACESAENQYGENAARDIADHIETLTRQQSAL